MWKNRLAFALLYAALLVTEFRGYIAGGRAWLNAMLDRWTTVHEGGLALFSGTASERDVWAFALLAAVLIGLLTWYAVSRQSSRLAAFISVFWLLLSLFGEGFYPLALVLLTRAFLLWNAERRRRRMSIEERVRQSQKLMFKLISLWGMTRRSAGRPRRPIRRLRTRCRRLSPESTSV